LRLLGAVLMEIDEAWATGHRYLDMAEYLTWMNKPKEAEVIQQRNNELEVA
ncbi:MAG: IS256 family transposase, partial [Moorellales bacterium]